MHSFALPIRLACLPHGCMGTRQTVSHPFCSQDADVLQITTRHREGIVQGASYCALLMPVHELLKPTVVHCLQLDVGMPLASVQKQEGRLRARSS